MEGRMRHNAGASLDDYMAVITRKTASLFAAGGSVAADLAGAPTEDHRRDGAAGTRRRVGVSDGRRPARHHGPGREDRQAGRLRSARGIISLPVVLSVQNNAELRRLFCSKLEGDNLKRALEIRREPSLIARGRGLAAEKVEHARTILMQDLEPSLYRDCLEKLIDDQIDRDL